MHPDPPAHLIGSPGSTGIVLVELPDRLPGVAWFGVVAPDLTADAVVELAPERVALLPEASHGWYGRPGLVGHRGPQAPAGWSTWFRPLRADVGPSHAVLLAADETAGLSLRTEVVAERHGTLRIRHTLTNTGDTDFVVDSLDVVLPVPDRATEMLDFTGRWSRERQPQRHSVRDGLWLRENRRGKTGFDSATVLLAGAPGFGFGTGSLWGAHVAWSGNSTYRLERSLHGKAMASTTTVGGGELLLPGEVILGAGESYATPWVHFTATTAGLDGIAAAHHTHVRALPAHPATPRPVTLNVWEAVFFDHDLTKLSGLVDTAASIGVERFVLDDGWFGSRRNDAAGLGDWTVSPDAWPDGLDPLVDHVRSAGMQFGLWFEPEMVNPDSDLYRAHPEWILATAGRVPPEERRQHVLDLGQPGAYAHVLDQMTETLSEHAVDYVKWDHNRDFVEPGSRVRGDRPGTHVQTERFYDLLDELRRRFPHIEWESCASGGARIDLEVLRRVERVWTSDQNDALTRQHIQRWTAQLVPPEYLGSHVSAHASHQTGRVLSLDFRAATAFFGHFGVEWDLSHASHSDLAALTGWIALHKAHRRLLHSGRLVRGDSAVEGFWVHEVVAQDRSEAIVAAVQLDDLAHDPPRIVVPGLDPARAYTVTRLAPDGPTRPVYVPPSRATGAMLGDLGLPGPPLAAQSIVLLHLS
ncbi:alpha-galactosidase [Acidothermaceae bacterium B102]|nr:alpha-galactosidase [Acidothermaceae bacterium B102]